MEVRPHTCIAKTGGATFSLPYFLWKLFKMTLFWLSLVTSHTTFSDNPTSYIRITVCDSFVSHPYFSRAEAPATSALEHSWLARLCLQQQTVCRDSTQIFRKTHFFRSHRRHAMQDVAVRSIFLRQLHIVTLPKYGWSSPRKIKTWTKSDKFLIFYLSFFLSFVLQVLSHEGRQYSKQNVNKTKDWRPEASFG